jgi:hypothetical protein
MTHKLSQKRSRSLSVDEHSSPIPSWLKPKSIARRHKLDYLTDNQHCIRSIDYLDVQWHMPLMFGDELYSYSVVDIPDERYAEESAVMSAKLMRLFYDSQIIEAEWRKTYKQFLAAETRKAKLTPGVSQKSRDKADRELESAKDQLLRLQDQRDLYSSVIRKIYDRCDQIKHSLMVEKGLKRLRQDLTEKVAKCHPSEDDPFWSTKFNVKL